jgi:hypothetical protein
VPASVCAEAIPDNVSKNAQNGRHRNQCLFAAALEFTEEVLFILELVRLASPAQCDGGEREM